MPQRSRIAGIAALALTIPLILSLPACKNPSDGEIKAALEVVDIQTKWVAKDYRQWPQPKLVLVPVISFRVKNLTAEPLKYVNFNAIFKRPGDIENLGDSFLAAIRKEPVPSGGLSPVITLKSNFGREGRTLEQFKNFPQELDYVVRLFAQFRGSRLVLLGEYTVSRDIDFKEDQPVHMEGKKIEPKLKVKGNLSGGPT